MRRRLKFVLQPEADFATLDTLSKSVEYIRKLIRHVDFAATGEKDRLWYIQRIESSAPTLTLASHMDGDDTIEALTVGLRDITETTISAPPEYFSEDALKQVSQLGQLFKGTDRLRHVEVSTDDDVSGPQLVATIRDNITKKVSSILSSGYYEFGTLEGRMEVINVHGKPAFTIWEQISGVPVRCTFANATEWKQHVRDLLEKHVMVEGNAYYFSNGLPRRISDVESVVDATPPIPDFKAEFGSIPDLTGTESTEDYLRRIRGG